MLAALLAAYLQQDRKNGQTADCIASCTWLKATGSYQIRNCTHTDAYQAYMKGGRHTMI